MQLKKRIKLCTCSFRNQLNGDEYKVDQDKVGKEASEMVKFRKVRTKEKL